MTDELFIVVIILVISMIVLAGCQPSQDIFPDNRKIDIIGHYYDPQYQSKDIKITDIKGNSFNISYK